MTTATVTSKGQITIPVQLRRALGLSTGTQVEIITTENGFMVKPLQTAQKPRDFKQYAGILDGSGKATQALLTERERDRL